MKKIFIFAFLFALFSSADAQAIFSHSTFNPTGTITNAGIDTMNITLSKGYGSISIQPVITKASGTVAGKAYLWYSVNGTNYTVQDSVTLTNVASQWTIWQVNSKPARYFRIITGGSTTVSATTSAKLQNN